MRQKTSKKRVSYLDRKMWRWFEKAHHNLGQLIRIEPTGEVSEKKQIRYLKLPEEKKRAYLERRIKRETDNFLTGKIENPFFGYFEDKRIDYQRIEQRLKQTKDYYRKIKTKSPKIEIVRDWYLAKIDQESAIAEIRKAAKENDGDRLAFFAKRAYLEPDRKIEKTALQILDRYFKKAKPSNSNNNKDFTARDVRYYFKAALYCYGIDNVKVKILRGRRTIIVHRIPKTNRIEIVIPTTTRANHKKLIKLIVHEIETHVLRKKSAEKQETILLLKRSTLPNYIETEEGLAIYNQQQLVGIEPQDPKDLSYILRALGVCWAKERDFRSTYEKLKKISARVYKKARYDQWEDQAEKLAWGTCVRIFRGINNTEKEGNYNPLILRYFRGNLAVWDYVKKGGSISKLYIGKIGLEHLADLRKIGITKPKIRPQFIARDIDRLDKVVADHKNQWDNKR